MIREGRTFTCARPSARLLGFEVGWLIFCTRVLSAAAALNVFVLYLAALVPSTGSGVPRMAVMATLVALVTLINVIGVRQATWTVDVFTLAKLLPIALLDPARGRPPFAP